MIWMPRCATRGPSLNCGRFRVCRVSQGRPSCEYHPQFFSSETWHRGPQGQPHPTSIFFFQTSFLHLALAVPELCVDQASLQRSTCLCLVSAGVKEEIKDVCHH